MALDMNHLGGVSGQGNAFVAVLLRDHFKNAVELSKSFFPAGHEGIASRYCGDLGRPGAVFLPVKYNLVILNARNEPQRS